MSSTPGINAHLATLQSLSTSGRSMHDMIRIEELLYMNVVWPTDHSADFSGDLERSRSSCECDFCVGGDECVDGGDAGPS